MAFKKDGKKHDEENSLSFLHVTLDIRRQSFFDDSKPVSHKSRLQVPAPAVVEETDENGSQEVTDQQGDVRGHRIGDDESHKLLKNLLTEYCISHQRIASLKG